MRAARRYLLNALVVLVAALLTVGAGFLVDHWLDLGLKRAVGRLFETNVQVPEPIMYAYDNRTGWILNPRTQYHRERAGPLLGLAGLERFDVRLRVNSEGFIDREHYLQTPHYRVAFVGNSWVEAVQQAFEHRFAPLTEDFVFLRSDRKKAVEVMNFGVSNLAPAHGFGVIKGFVLKYRPDEVWLFVNGWDLESNTPLASPPPFGPTYEYTDATRSELRDIRFGHVDPPALGSWKRERDVAPLLKGTPSFGAVMPYFYSAESNPLFDRVWTDMKLVTTLIKKTLDREKVRLRIVYLPAPFEVDPPRWAEFTRKSTQAIGRQLALDPAIGERRYATLAGELGVDFISLVGICKGKGAKEMFADHFSRTGHYWVAETLAKVLIDTAPADRVQVR